MSIIYEVIKSWKDTKGTANSLNDILGWIENREAGLRVNVEKVDFSYDGFWYYDEVDGYIRNKNNSFFQLAGYQEIVDDIIVNEQPVIIQNEIGYLGLICKKINGVVNFLMQAKIEPGNVNMIQISPTIQATQSNFTRRHGGSIPPYLDYFINSSKYKIIVDQIQSEQSSRFYKKRNRNIIIYIEDDIEILDSHKWMTLGQIKKLMTIDNLVNMDTRTVLSCIPYSKSYIEKEEFQNIMSLFEDKPLYYSMFESGSDEIFHEIFHQINDYKMYKKNQSRLVPIKSLKNWVATDKEIVCKTPFDFKIIYCYIEIEGREVKYWEQPLIEANGIAILGTFTCVENGIRKFLVRVKPEIGCFDGAELGPTIQLEPSNPRNNIDRIEQLFLEKLGEKSGFKKDVILSEEGGRFFHEQNRNVIIEITPEDIKHLPIDYFWVDYALLNKFVQFNNCLNIQLRNLLALLDL